MIRTMVVIMVCALSVGMGACSGSSSPTVPATPTPSPADQQFVNSVNAIKDKYPADTTGHLTLPDLTVWVDTSCSLIASGLAKGPEWIELGALLSRTKRCP